MSWNYSKYLEQQIKEVMNDLSLTNFQFAITDEQSFVKMNFLEDRKVYVIVKMLTSNITIDAKTQPVQIQILSEKNSLDNARLIFSTFAEKYNFKVEFDGQGTFIKQQYSQPVVLGNFSEVKNGFRSILYMTGTLLIMENLIDIYTFDENGEEVRNAITINNEIVKVLSFNLAYSMTPNTQPIPPQKIATSVKSVATFSIVFTIPPKSTSIYNFLSVMINIMAGKASGNTDFTVDFWLGEIHFEEIDMKMTSSNLVSGPNQVPGLQIALLR